ncbi:hypothetical protein V8B97DRAFT_2001988 [Scleroderma yunnanense]
MADRPSPETLATAAALRRNENLVDFPSEVQEHEKRQMFRRLIDPGIFRPNSRETALASLKTLATIAENLLREPDNPKFQQFKQTNDLIKRRLVETKGALEYAIEATWVQTKGKLFSLTTSDSDKTRVNLMQVKDLQSYYVFNPRYRADLHIGAAILKETIDLETKKQGRIQRSKAEEKAAAAAAVKLAFMDDRKTKALHDQRERSMREANEMKQASGGSISDGNESPLPDIVMPGIGYTLASSHPVAGDQPEE